VHGAVAPDAFKSEFATVMEIYLNTRDGAAASAAAQDLADTAGIGSGM
jgi:glucose/mannose transport system substrate-binding protein